MSEEQIMDVQYFPIDKVLPNPYQMRLSEDEAHVAGLAEDIAANGLLQIPTARPHPKKSGAVELAFGHSRLAAYQRLAANGRGADYSKFPLVIKELNNRQMSDLAASENARRKNLSPIETARAIMRRKKDFKLGNAEAGAPFGLGESAAANLLRLLDLPDDVQTQVDTGELPQRLARQLVNVNRTDPKAAKAIAKAVAKSPAGVREEVLSDAMADHLRRHLRLHNAPWDPHWLATPRPLDAQLAAVISGPAVNDATEAGLTELRACAGCPNRLVYGGEDYCTLAACFQAKLRLHEDQAATRVSDKLGVPRAAADEKPVDLREVFRNLYYSEHVKVTALVKAFPKAPELGLRVIAGDVDWGWWHYLDERRVGLGTVAPKEVSAWLKRGQAKTAKGGKAGKAAKDPETARQAELEAAEARRAERAAKQRELHDCTWLVRHVTPIIAEQLTISGQVLAYVVGEMQQVNDSGSNLFPGLGGFDEELRDAAKQAPPAERDGLLRQLLVAGEVLHHTFDYRVEHHVREGRAWAHIREATKKLATTGLDGAGFGAKLPAGWDKAPVHRTPWNCWQCGAFTGGTRVTKRDLAAGWIVRGKEDKPDLVACSAAHEAAFVKSAGKKVVKQ